VPLSNSGGCRASRGVVVLAKHPGKGLDYRSSGKAGRSLRMFG